MFDFKIILYIIFGILPSLVWLAYYLGKDLHPEPKKTILKIFLWGAFITIPVFFVQSGLAKILDTILFKLDFPRLACSIYDSCLSPYLDYLLGTPLSYLNTFQFSMTLTYWFLVISLTEEFFKFLIVRLKIFSSPDLDEPLDIMLYMVVAALGFAALENILYLFNPATGLSLNELIQKTLLLSFVRFVGATFLHTLCSAVIGYSMAISICDKKNRILEATMGIIVAVLLHGLYDFSIMKLDGYLSMAIPAAILLVLALLTFLGFEKLKKIKSVTILN